MWRQFALSSPHSIAGGYNHGPAPRGGTSPQSTRSPEARTFSSRPSRPAQRDIPAAWRGHGSVKGCQIWRLSKARSSVVIIDFARNQIKRFRFTRSTPYQNKQHILEKRWLATTLDTVASNQVFEKPLLELLFEAQQIHIASIFDPPAGTG